MKRGIEQGLRGSPESLHPYLDSCDYVMPSCIIQDDVPF